MSDRVTREQREWLDRLADARWGDIMPTPPGGVTEGDITVIARELARILRTVLPPEDGLLHDVEGEP